ncbi:rod shape-determining protein [Tissierella sp. MSJ-40]|uniref:Rod shape-determining protein n=1 Tax=Tissierella simiarum TaxID=2841534 RepID=A0ABS6E4L0_9FIRM|nr:cell division FtsA domain-containing protein [Tissierella simiarum]MBU5437850.1 rod shape-determining protein [Tissierella simiarum]
MKHWEETREDLIFSLDIGTRTIIGIVGEYTEDEKFKILAYTIKEHNRRNMYDGQIHDIEGVTKIVKEIKKDLEEKIDAPLKRVSIAAAGRALKTYKIKVEQFCDSLSEISKRTIEALELEAVQRAQEEINAQDSNKSFKYYSIGYSVVDYFLDDNKMEKLEEHRGEKIGVELLATFLPQVVIESLYSVISKVGLEVGSITLEPIAAINVAIKEELRLLNLALVDIGAGTSDIAITKDGHIISYAMTSTAGDEITERLAKAYLLDFNNSEKLKVELSQKDEHEFTDVLGISYKMSTTEIVDNIFDIIEKIAIEISERILEYNGKAPSAVFLVGGSSQMPRLKETLAEKLGIPKERVAIRDTTFIENIEGLEDIKGPDMITPIGIAMEGIQDKYRNFLKVLFNGEEVRIFNTENIKVSDILVLTGFNPRKLIPERGEDFIYYIDGKKRIIKGENGTSPEILVNGKLANLKTALQDKDVVAIVPGIKGKTKIPYLYDCIVRDKIISLNKEEVNLIRTIKVNGKVIEENIQLKMGDSIEIEEIKDIDSLLKYLDRDYNINDLLINGKKIENNYCLKNGDLITTKEDKKSINLIVNGEDKTIVFDKEEFIFVDIFNYINFDLSAIKGKLVLKTNGKEAEYMEPLKDGDKLEIYWE